jgi:alkylation response protein AidB-like acyl-CoA dehydrogenase
MEVFEELGRGDAALAFSLSMHNAVAAAVCGCDDERLRGRWATDLAAGRALGGFSLTEPQAGSDATAITTQARADGGGWRVRGRKAWVSLAGAADLFLVVCKTSPAPGHADIAILAVDAASAEVSFPVVYRKAAAHFLPIGEMALDDAPATMLAPPGAGMRAALQAIDVARCDIAAIACGLHAEALDIALRHARTRHVFGRPLIELDTLRFALADVLTDLEAGRLLYDRAAHALGTPAGPVAVAHAKRFCPDAALRTAVACSEVLGAYGWLEDTPLPRFIALAKMLQVVDGTAEIQRLVIGRELARMAKALPS